MTKSRPPRKIPSPKKVNAFSPIEGDDLARKEAEGFSEITLEEEAKRNAHEREEKKKAFLWWLSIIITGLVIFGIAIMGIIWFIHLTIPSLRWMDSHDLTELKSILFSSIISAIIAPFIKEHFSN